jgi:thioredoxin 1
LLSLEGIELDFIQKEKQFNMSKINHISSQSHLDKTLSTNIYVIADFYADWCGPCKAIAPVFEQLANSETKPGRLAFVKIDVDSQQGIARKYGVSA